MLICADGFVPGFGEDFACVCQGAGGVLGLVEQGVAQGSHGLRPGAGPDAASVLAEDDVARPVRTVPETPSRLTPTRRPLMRP